MGSTHRFWTEHEPTTIVLIGAAVILARVFGVRVDNGLVTRLQARPHCKRSDYSLVCDETLMATLGLPHVLHPRPHFYSRSSSLVG